jgi:peptidoglycan/LPS O-acetylase OafA/YrhL
LLGVTDKKAFFTEVVGLRVYLAVWVAIGHGLESAGFLRGTNLPLKVLLAGHQSVIIFMIVSGFVITNLLLVKQESYPRYIVRRFFRLYPVYVLGCLAGYLIMNNWVDLVNAMPWTATPAGAKYAQGIYENAHQITYNFLPHFIAHAVMLHGAVPSELLPHASKTFLPAAWSISLEWQFYLVAPAVIAALRNRWRLLAVLLISLFALEAYKKGVLGHYSGESIILANSQYFLIGIASRLAYDRLSALPVSPLVVAVGVVFATAAMIKTAAALPFLIWGTFYAYSLWHRRATVTGPVFRALTQNRVMQLLGEASYSLYLIHRPVQILLAVALVGSITVTRWSMLAIEMGAIPIAALLSLGLYFTIERAGIRLGHQVARRIPAAVPAAAPVAVAAD